jgi:hypothetical protein
MIRRSAAALVLVLAATSALRADWRQDLKARLGRDPDYRAAWDLLAEEAKKLEGEDKRTAAFILPFLASKLGDDTGEQDLVADYFETYLDNDPDFGFLDEFTIRGLLAFWAFWKRAYPLVYDLNLLAYPRTPVTGLPSSVDIGLELLNDAFYRLSLGPYILEGGFWPRGFHILTIPLRGLFERSDTFEFILDLKSGDIVCRKPVRVRVELADISGAPAPTLRQEPERGPSLPLRQVKQGEISVYIDGKLVLRSRKLAPRPLSFGFPLGGPLLQGQKPYMPPPTNSPLNTGVNLNDAIALAYKAIKDLVAKRPPKPLAPSYQKVGSLSFSYSRTATGGRSVSARASLTLPPGRAVIFREQAPI